VNLLIDLTKIKLSMDLLTNLTKVELTTVEF